MNFFWNKLSITPPPHKHIYTFGRSNHSLQSQISALSMSVLMFSLWDNSKFPSLLLTDIAHLCVNNKSVSAWRFFTSSGSVHLKALCSFKAFYVTTCWLFLEFGLYVIITYTPRSSCFLKLCYERTGSPYISDFCGLIYWVQK